MKKLIIITVFGLLTASSQAQNGADSILNFLTRNKEKASFYLQKNDYILSRLNEEKLMPVPGAMNIIIAVEFAKQAAYNVFSYNKPVDINEVNKYYLPGSDGDAHKKWLAYETKQGHLKQDSIKLIDIAKGMVMFGSQANAEYLMEMLGFGNLQNDLRMFKLTKHTLLFPMPSSLFLYQNPKKLNEDKVLKEIETLHDSDYYRSIFAIHKELKFDSVYKDKFRPQDLSSKMLKTWSERLPSSTAKEYIRVAHTINNRLILNDKTYSVLSRILETIMETTSANKLWLRQAGMISGSTPTSFSRVTYAILRDGVPGGKATKIELVYFFNGLNSKENYNLQRWMSDFDLKILKDDKFRTKVVDAIAGKKK